MRIIQREKANYASGLYNLSQTDIEPQKDKRLTHIYEGKTQKLWKLLQQGAIYKVS